ncbi:unnamed protein product [Arabidopsis arenosa]|uniref:NYN domain-containing protein n=1 Tax=Arabidopsis arenosa TaxID=38785 RepID=A0A8S2B1W0_ARAAE|nr:unnamed protein product [Arabidopsis arenosa]
MSDPRSSDEEMFYPEALTCDPRLPDASIYGPNFDSYMDAKTCVFWDVEDYPIPNGSDPVLLGQKIKSVLLAANYRGEVSIKAYVDTLSDELRSQYLDAGITVDLMPQGDEYARISPLFVDAYVWALDNPAPANMIVLSKKVVESVESERAVVLSDTDLSWLPLDTDWLPPLARSTLFLTGLFDDKKRKREDTLTMASSETKMNKVRENEEAISNADSEE